jgi:acyl-CoA thioester hydrolase
MGVQMPFKTVIAVRYVETDQSGIVHHSHYLPYFEVARIDAILQIGLDHIAFERNGLFMAVVDAGQKYHSPARYGDQLTVNTWLREVSRVRIRFSYEVTRQSERIASGFTLLACLSKNDNRPMRLPDAILNILKQKVEPEST